MKYVILQHREDGQELAVFALGFQAHHLQMAEAYPAYAPVSAGHVKFLTDGTAVVWGESKTLKRSPGINDARFLTAFYRAALTTAPAEPEPIKPAKV